MDQHNASMLWPEHGRNCIGRVLTGLAFSGQFVVYVHERGVFSEIHCPCRKGSSVKRRSVNIWQHYGVLTLRVE